MNSRQFALSWVFSGFIHLGAFAALVYVTASSNPLEFAVDRGGAELTIVFVAAASGAPIPAFEIELAEVPLVEDRESIEPAATHVARRVIAELAATDVRPPDLPESSEQRPATAKPPRPQRNPLPQESAVVADVSPAERSEIQRVLELKVIPLTVAISSRGGAQVDSLPQKLPDNPAPRYPFDAYQLGVQGRVMLEVVVDGRGLVSDIRVVESSGHESLDKSALATVRTWRFLPARRLGVPVSDTVRVPIRFSIRDRT
jgi:TonB family protein